MRRVVLVVLLAAAFAAPASGARRAAPVLLGIKGNAGRFHAQTGQASAIRHVIVAWGQGQSWGSRFPQLFRRLGGIPMLGLSTGDGHGGERITPQQIAEGKGDSYLVALNQGVAAFGQEVYIRPFGEMNGYWNAYCAYTKEGRIKPGHQTSWFRKAFARVYLVVHGGAGVDAQLARLGLPPVAGGAGARLAENSAATTHVVWNPQGFGDPDVPGNSAQAYYPGDRYVDVVGDDLYDIGGKAEWAAADALYRAHPGKPFSFPEWGLWGIDDPAFVQAMATFIRTHPRTGVVAYFGSGPGSVFDLAAKPKSRAAYARLITPLGS
ncbi:MAG TPA: hypothetical protein VHD91_04520 [Gaiellaceae bacterium]|nr:hypothetical protein [Gaiellaceae bacterium]